MILDGHKLAWHRDRVEAWLRGERIAPITIDCALTRRCNYDCSYCYGKLQGQADEREMGWDTIARFLDDAAEIGVKGISFVSDGESTLHPNLYHAILRGYDNGIDMALGTNGFLLKRDSMEEWLPALSYLRVNVSAGEPHRYAEIHGVQRGDFWVVARKIQEAVEVKKKLGLKTTIGMQMVLRPEFADQVIPLAELGKWLGVDYLVIKHCSDDENHALGVDYQAYYAMEDLLRRAEAMSTPTYQVKVKWSKILSGGVRRYKQCYGPPFIMQFSGSGLVAPCGMLFNDRYKQYHIGNLADQGLKALWQGERYWEVMNTLASERFDARTMCGSLCLQHCVNNALWMLKHGSDLPPATETPEHVNFV